MRYLCPFGGIFVIFLRQALTFLSFHPYKSNLPLKTRSIYHFARRYCSAEFKYYYFHDSDTILHPNIETLIHKNETDPRNNAGFNNMKVMSKPLSGIGNYTILLKYRQTPVKIKNFWRNPEIFIKK